MLEQKIEQDLKAALLSGDSQRVSTLRGLKSTLLNTKIATGKRDSGLSDDEVLTQLAKQAKQRQESADMYVQGGDQVRADKELAEKAIIEEYLPTQLSEAEISKLIDDVIAESGLSAGPQAMGQVIGQVKQKAGAAADGAVIARLAKEKLQ
ncbi:MAG TPA: GatB/YqeY domain-containing protein [Candidatus Dormibacteraeota bacterium]|nr:GatB/YqeY domain-containing protein [Candidatus Dormibacteraeota bacterium]